MQLQAGGNEAARGATGVGLDRRRERDRRGDLRNCRVLWCICTAGARWVRLRNRCDYHRRGCIRRYCNSTLSVDPADGDYKIDMKQSWNWSLWIGFLFALAGFFSYTFFAQSQSRAISPGRISCCLLRAEFVSWWDYSVHLAMPGLIAARSSDQFCPRWRY